jgi:DNA polymerase-3 subunit epsilon
MPKDAAPGRAERAGLRLRMAAFFALIALAIVALIGGALAMFARAPAGEEARALALYGGGAAFALVGLVVWVALKFDENVARPLQRIAADARAAAHAAAGAEAVDAEGAGRWLGQLTPAAREMAARLAAARMETERAVRRAVADAARTRRQLEAVLQELDEGVAICALDHRLTLYNRRAAELLQAGDGPGCGLGRPLGDLLAEPPLRHALERATGRFEDGRWRAHPAGLSVPLLTVSADGGRTLQGRLTLMLDETEERPAGYLVALEDATDPLRDLLRRDRLLRQGAADLARPIAALREAARALSAAEGERRRALAAAVGEQTDAVAEKVGRIEAEARALVTASWPMSDVFSPTLFAAVIRRRTGPQNFSAEIVGAPLWLRCDGFACVEMLDALMNRVADGLSVRAFTLSAAREGERVRLALGWRGPPAPPELLEAWMGEPLDPAAGGVTPREALALHGAELRAEAEAETGAETGAETETKTGAGAARLSIALPGPQEAHRGRPPRREARPEFYDFELLRRAPPPATAGAELRALDYVVFDCETTGLDPKGGDRLVQIAGVRVVNGRVLRGETFDLLVDPGRPIPTASTKIHGIDDRMVAGAPAPLEAARRFHRFARGAPLVAHNAAFDMAFLVRAAAADPRLAFDQPVLDTVLLAAHLHAPGDDLTLDALAERFAINLPPEARHSALGDSLATAELMLRLFDMLQAQGIVTLGQALEASRGASTIRRRQAAY